MDHAIPIHNQLMSSCWKLTKTRTPTLRVYPEQIEVEKRIIKLEEQIEERNQTIANLLINGDRKATEIDELEQKLIGLETLLTRVMPSVEQLQKQQRKKKKIKKK